MGLIQAPFLENVGEKKRLISIYYAIAKFLSVTRRRISGSEENKPTNNTFEPTYNQAARIYQRNIHIDMWMVQYVNSRPSIATILNYL